MAFGDLAQAVAEDKGQSDTFTATLAGAATAGNLLIAAGGIRTGTAINAVPAGYTEIVREENDVTAGWSIWAGYKISDGTETTATLQFGSSWWGSCTLVEYDLAGSTVNYVLGTPNRVNDTSITLADITPATSQNITLALLIGKNANAFRNDQAFTGTPTAVDKTLSDDGTTSAEATIARWLDAVSQGTTFSSSSAGDWIWGSMLEFSAEEGPSIGSVTASTPTDTTLPAGSTATAVNADGGTYWAGIWPQSSRPTTHAQIIGGIGAVGAVETNAIPVGGALTFGEFTGLTEATPYALYVTAVDDQATPVPDGQAGFDDFTTLQQQLVVVIPLVNVENGQDWPDGRTILYDLWLATRWHDETTAQAADEIGSGLTADGGILTISTFALAAGDPTFTVMYEEEGTTPGFSPDDYFGVSRQNSVENGLIDANGAAQYIESPLASGNWVETRNHIAGKQLMAKTVVVMEVPPTGSTFTLSFEFDTPVEMLNVNLWRALGKGPPATATSVVPINLRTLEVSFDKDYNSGDTAVLQFQGVKGSSGFVVPRSTWPRKQP